MAAKGLVHGALGRKSVHLCVDMQKLFGPGSPWAMPWMERILPPVVALCAAHPARTVFTRFIPFRNAAEAPGTWQRYYRRWEHVTLERIGEDAIGLAPELQRFVPPATVIDKHVYSPWTEGRLGPLLARSGIDTVVISGGETDVCVLATVLGAIDRGLRVVIVGDALCSSSDDTHDALMELYLNRFSEQVEVSSTDEVLDQWRD